MTPTVGERLGPYEILGRLGRGGMGLVFRAWDGRLHREVAIKLLGSNAFAPGGKYPVPGSRERFLQEARAASALNHPHICTVFDIGEKDGAPYLVMELMVGETLKERIEHSPLLVEELVEYGVEIAEALGAAHARGIVHRDIKPANIFLVERPNGDRLTKVLDFGLAKVAPAQDRRAAGRFGREMPANLANLTSDGATVGTVAYMSPEQARGEALDGRSDLFSLGVVLYEMATRRSPFQGTTNAMTFVQLLNHEPEPIRDWNDTVPKGLEKIIAQLMEKDAGERFQTAAEVSAALSGLALKNGGGWLKRATPAVPLVRSTDPVARERRPLRGLGDYESGAGDVRARRGSSGGVKNAVLRPLTHSRELDSVPVVMPVPEGVVEARMSEVDLAAAADEAELQRGAVVNGSAGGGAAGQYGRRWHERERPVGSGVASDSASAQPVEREARGRLLQNDEAFGRVRERNLLESSEEVAVREVTVPPGRVTRIRRRRIWIGGAMAGVAVCVGVAVLVGRWMRPPVLGPGERLMVTAMENRTGDATLDGAVAQGLEFALAESPNVALRGGDAYRGALLRMGARGDATPVLARQAAQAAGVKAYLYGSLSLREGAGYTVSVKLLDAASNRELASVEETAAGREQIPGAIDRVVEGLRVEVGLGGGPGDSVARSDVPLAREATASVEALHAYSVGVAAMADGRTGDAQRAFQAAATIDPKFAQAQMRLAWLYRAQHAEVASAGAARLAAAASGNASAHTALLAQYSDAVNATGDLERAGTVIRQFAALYPHDPEGARGVARVLRLQGRFGEALDVAERGIADGPQDGELYGQAEFSLIALDRYDAALGVEQQAEQLGLARSGTALTAAYLAGRDDRLESAIERVTRPPYNVNSMTAYGLYLDNTGQLAAGATLWRKAAAGDGWMLAQGALDRGLAGDCGVGLEMARGVDAQGMTVSFNVGMAAALCGDKALAAREIAVLTQDWAGASAVQGYYLPDLRAAMALGEHDPQGALDALKGARPYDLVSLTPYLRGLAHVALHEYGPAVVDFQTVLGHRGVAVTGGSDVYPMAEIGLARAYAASGDRANSARAYRRFLELWGRGDAGETLRMEADKWLVVSGQW